MNHKPRTRVHEAHPPLDWPDDPVVAEVRAIRAKLWQEAGGTVAGFIKLVRNRVVASESANPGANGRRRVAHRRRARQARTK